MANGVINLVLKSTAEGSGFADAQRKTKELISNTNDLSGAAKKLGGAFGNAGNLVGQLFANILKGGIWGVMAAGVNLVIDQWKKHVSSLLNKLVYGNGVTGAAIDDLKRMTPAMLDRALRRAWELNRWEFKDGEDTRASVAWHALIEEIRGKSAAKQEGGAE